ncbi:hypothetical protein MAR_010190, partial [Mya arenaria]
MVRCACDMQSNLIHYHSCIDQWALVRENKKQPSAFLRNPQLVDDICLRSIDTPHRTIDNNITRVRGSDDGRGVERLDQCVKRRVSGMCDNIRTSWDGFHLMLQLLCKHRKGTTLSITWAEWAQTSSRHAFQTTRITTETTGIIMISLTLYPPTLSQKQTPRLASNKKQNNEQANRDIVFRELSGCIDRNLRAYCPGKARLFFKLLLRAEIEPVMEYINCFNKHKAIMVPLDYYYTYNGDPGVTDGQLDDVVEATGVHYNEPYVLIAVRRCMQLAPEIGVGHYLVFVELDGKLAIAEVKSLLDLEHPLVRLEWDHSCPGFDGEMGGSDLPGGSTIREWRVTGGKYPTSTI